MCIHVHQMCSDVRYLCGYVQVCAVQTCPRCRSLRLPFWSLIADLWSLPAALSPLIPRLRCLRALLFNPHQCDPCSPTSRAALMLFWFSVVQLLSAFSVLCGSSQIPILPASLALVRALSGQCQGTKNAKTLGIIDLSAMSAMSGLK